MKESRFLTAFVVGFGLVAATTKVASSAGSGLQTQGAGKQKVLVESQFPAERRVQYTLFKEKCTQCHEMARPIAALETGVTPISGDSFEEAGIKKYVVKMMRKPNSGIDKDDAKTLIEFLQYARGLAKGSGG